MRDRRLNGSLRRIHGAERPRSMRPGHRDELAARLLADYRQDRARNRRWLMLLNPWNRSARFALVAVALVVLGVGACTTSTTTEMEMGQKLSIGLTAKADLAAVDADVTAFLDAQPGVENVGISISETVGGPAVLEVVAWGAGLDREQLVADLRAAVPALADADIAVEALTGTFEESFASKLGREVFQLEVSGATAEEIRAEILAQLAASGQDEGAEVDVQMSDGQAEIRITVEQEAE